MSLVLNEEQIFLKDSAKKFASEKTPTTHFREVRDSEIENCYDEKIWQEMVSLGWTGILVPEEYGGSNFGVAGISSILEDIKLSIFCTIWCINTYKYLIGINFNLILTW